jgi:CRAL/TRIO domain
LGIAQKGNGEDEELSKSQLMLIHELYDRVSPYRDELAPHDSDWCDHETCRRYIVARSWNIEKAEEQLVDTLKWRAKEHPGGRPFWQAPKALHNPLSLNMRIVGWDSHGRPIGYTRFSQAHDRWDANANLEHLTLIMESAVRMIRERCKRGYNATADTRQCIWLIDFDGFSIRDQNPKTAVMVARLLNHYPEILHACVLLDAPLLFNGLWKLVSPLLDERVQRKIMFVKGKQADSVLRERFGSDAADWIAAEVKDCAEKQRQKMLKKYWIPPKHEGEHDPRGIPSYVRSDLYIKTPGDAYEEAKQGKLQPKETRKSVEEEANSHAHVSVAVKTLYKGTF